VLRWFSERIAKSGDESEEDLLRLESDADAVKILTIHKSKGLEFNVVWCPDLWNGKVDPRRDAAFVRFHDEADSNREKAVFDAAEGFEDAKARFRREEFAEGMRLLYVALTRAKYCCKVLWGAVKSFETSGLGYLLHSRKDAADPLAAAAAIKEKTDAELKGDIEALASCSGGAICFETESGPAARLLSAAGGAAAAPVCAKAVRELRPSFRRTSFSGMTASEKDLTTAQVEGQDLDEAAIDSRQADAPARSGKPIALSGFPGGAAAGTFFHSVFERIDFGWSAGEIAAVAQGLLDTGGFGAQQWQDRVAAAVWRALRCRLDDGVDGLFRIPNADRLNELEFVLPATRGASGACFTAESLAGFFAKPPSAGVTDSYCAKARRLDFPPLEGFLRGFVDLVFEHQGRIYLCDYKSNNLGGCVEDYDLAAMNGEMEKHHYFLQYYLYCAALYRYFSVREPGFSWEARFGKVFYLFFKGMDPDLGPKFGVFSDRPSEDAVKRLSALFGDFGGLEKL
jgi:exodeoxyribonuclease V beta subunit